MMKLHYKTSTSALPNAGSRRGDANPSRAGLAACTSPEVGGRKANNSHTGVSTNCVLKKSDLYIREPQVAVYNEEAETAAIAQMHEKNADTKVEKVSQTDIRFTVNAKSSDILFTTIPAEKGWTVYVDGVKTDYDTALNDALMTVKLSEGEHVVEFKFFAAGLGTGLILTVIGIAVFVGMILIYLKIKKPVKLSKAVNNDGDIDKDKTDAIIESDISEESEGKE